MRFLRLRYFLGAALAGLAVWMVLRPRDWQNWLGFSHDAYFKTGESYAFFSGIGPVLIGALGLTSILVTLLHHVNCHVDGCPRISRHKIAGGEYGVCGRHWRAVNDHADDHKYTVEHIRDHHRAHLRAVGRHHGQGGAGGSSGFTGGGGGGGGAGYGGGSGGQGGAGGSVVVHSGGGVGGAGGRSA